MPILSTAPISAALRLAETAGQGIGWQQAFQRDIQLMSLAQQSQAEYNRQQAQERAFALQTAALQARTPTAAQQRVSPYAKAARPSAADLREIGQQRQQSAQMQELENQLNQGLIDPATYSRNKLRILGGQGVQYPSEFAPKQPTEAYLNAVTAEERTRLHVLQTQRENVGRYLLDPESENRDYWLNQATDLDKQISQTAQSLKIKTQAVYDPILGRTQAPVVPGQGTESLPDPSGYPEGQVLQNTVNGQLIRVVKRDGQWRQI